MSKGTKFYEFLWNIDVQNQAAYFFMHKPAEAQAHIYAR